MFPPNSIILVDMDGVLADYDASLYHDWENNPTVQENNWLPLHNEQWPSIMKRPTQLHERWGPEAVKTFRDILSTENFYLNLKPIPNALETIRALDAAGHTVRICTAPSRHVNTCIAEKIEWVRNHLGPEWVDRVIVTRDKTQVRGDYLIDDKPEITGVYKPEWKHIMFAAPHNNSNITWETIIKTENLTLNTHTPTKPTPKHQNTPTTHGKPTRPTRPTPPTTHTTNPTPKPQTPPQNQQTTPTRYPPQTKQTPSQNPNPKQHPTPKPKPKPTPPPNTYAMVNVKNTFLGKNGRIWVEEHTRGNRKIKGYWRKPRHR